PGRGPTRWSSPRAAHAATCALELKPSFRKMLATWRAAVAGLITSSWAMALLLRPRAIRATIWRSRGVSPPGAVAPAAASRSPAAAGGTANASSTAELASRAEPSAFRPQPRDGRRPEGGGRGEHALRPGGGPRRQLRGLAQRSRGGGQLHGPVRPVLLRGEGGEGLKPPDHADAVAHGPAHPGALRQ